MNRSTRLPLAFGMLMLFILAGCGGSKPLTLNLTVVGTSNLNSSPEEERGNPARVSIYELNNDANFRTVTIETFWQNAEGALGAELIRAHPVVQLDPNQREAVAFVPAEGTRFIGVAADLRYPDPEAWRQIVSIEEVQGTAMAISIQVGRDRVTVTVL